MNYIFQNTNGKGKEYVPSESVVAVVILRGAATGGRRRPGTAAACGLAQDDDAGRKQGGMPGCIAVGGGGALERRGLPPAVQNGGPARIMGAAVDQELLARTLFTVHRAPGSSEEKWWHTGE